MAGTLIRHTADVGDAAESNPRTLERFGEAARALLTSERLGVLATLSARHGGWPFASVAPYALTGRGEPLFLLSDLAEHTRNVQADPRASLLVQDPASREDPQAGARITLLGWFELVPGPEQTAARATYLVRHPRAETYAGLPDFRLYVLHPTHARYVGGFGDMGWIDASALISG